MALADLFPGLGLRLEAYALVGMGAVVAAATHAPITGTREMPRIHRERLFLAASGCGERFTVVDGAARVRTAGRRAFHASTHAG